MASETEKIAHNLPSRVRRGRERGKARIASFRQALTSSYCPSFNKTSDVGVVLFFVLSFRHKIFHKLMAIPDGVRGSLHCTSLDIIVKVEIWLSTFRSTILFQSFCQFQTFIEHFHCKQVMEVQNPDGCTHRWWKSLNDGVRIVFSEWENLVKDDGRFEILTGLKEEEGKIETEK